MKTQREIDQEAYETSLAGYKLPKKVKSDRVDDMGNNAKRVWYESYGPLSITRIKSPSGSLGDWYVLHTEMAIALGLTFKKKPEAVEYARVLLHANDKLKVGLEAEEIDYDTHGVKLLPVIKYFRSRDNADVPVGPWTPRKRRIFSPKHGRVVLLFALFGMQSCSAIRDARLSQEIERAFRQSTPAHAAEYAMGERYR